MTTNRTDGAGQRAKYFADAYQVIAPMAVTWGIGLPVGIVAVFMWPNFPVGSAAVYSVMFLAMAVPIFTILSFMLILASFRLLLWAVSDGSQERKRDVNGRFIPATSPKKTKYLWAGEEIEDDTVG